MIFKAKITDVPALKSMWALCFADTPEFIRFYFEKIFRPEETPVYYIDGVPAAALQIIPYQIKLNNSIYTAGYISGAMTHPGHRKKGLMRELLLFSFEEMKRQKIPLSFLIPQEKWLFDFYGKFGYQRAFPKTIETLPVPCADSSQCHQFKCETCDSSLRGTKQSSLQTFWIASFPLFGGVCNAVAFLFGGVDSSLFGGVDSSLFGGVCNAVATPRHFSSLYPLYYSFLSRQENVVLKTPVQFEAMLEELYLEGGVVFTVDSGERGIAFAVPETDSVLIKEFFYDCETTKQQMLSAIQKVFQRKTVRCVFRHSEEKEHLFGMIKVLDETMFHVGLPGIYMSMMLD